MVGPTVRSIFTKVDVQKADGSLSRDEVEAMIRKAKVGGGLFGGIVLSMATDAFMDTLDTDKSGAIAFDEIKTQLKTVFSQIGGSMDPNLPQDPAEIPAKVKEWFDLTDASKDGKLTVKEAQAQIQRILEEKDVDMAGTKAEVAAKIAVYLVDENADGFVSWDEVDSLTQDVIKEAQPTEPAPAPTEPQTEPTPVEAWV